MDSVALGARLVLAIVFAVAGSAKLLDQSGARRALAGFGAPRRSLGPLAVLLPLAELATAAGLMVQQTARLGAIAGVGLLAVFIAGIANAMARGREPDCHCFGQLSSAPVGRKTLMRNALLAVPAALVVAYGPGESLDTWVKARSPAELVAAGIGIAAAVLGASCVRLLLENRRLRADLARARAVSEVFPQGLPIGAPAPRFALPTADGQTITLEGLLERGNPVALVFLSPSCASCDLMIPDLARWQSTLADRLTIALIVAGTQRQVRPYIEQHQLMHMLVDGDNEVFEAYRMMATPTCVIVTPEGRIGTQTSTTKVLVEALIRRALRTATEERAKTSPVTNGEPLVIQQSSTAG